MKNPYNVQRLEEFRKDVERLRKSKTIRFLAEIAEKTGVNKGNLSSYYNGHKPIGDKFLAAFKNAYKLELEQIDGYPSLSDFEKQGVSQVSDLEENYHDNNVLQELNNRLSNIERAVETLTQQLANLLSKKVAPEKDKGKKASKRKK